MSIPIPRHLKNQVKSLSITEQCSLKMAAKDEFLFFPLKYPIISAFLEKVHTFDLSEFKVLTSNHTITNDHLIISTLPRELLFFLVLKLEHDKLLCLENCFNSHITKMNTPLTTFIKKNNFCSLL